MYIQYIHKLTNTFHKLHLSRQFWKDMFLYIMTLSFVFLFGPLVVPKETSLFPCLWSNTSANHLPPLEPSSSLEGSSTSGIAQSCTEQGTWVLLSLCSEISHCLLDPWFCLLIWFTELNIIIALYKYMMLILFTSNDAQFPIISVTLECVVKYLHCVVKHTLLNDLMKVVIHQHNRETLLWC